MWRSFFLASILFSLQAGAQVCTGQGLRTVELAERALAQNHTEETRSLLQRAHEECQVSPAVLKKIADVYDALGDSWQAKQFRTLAVRIEATSSISNQPDPARDNDNGSTEDSSFVREKWALVVGISRFQNPAIRQLQFSAKDAKDLAAVLTDPQVGRFRQDHLKLLTDEEATVDGIRTAMNEIVGNSRKEDLVLIYFSSHGTDAGSDVASEEGKSGYIVTYNTDPKNLYTTAYSMDDLWRLVYTRIRAGRVVTFMDTCYSGGVHGSTRGSKALQVGIADDAIARIAQGKGRVVIASSRDTEQSWESETYKNSYFTHYIIHALTQSKGLLTVTNLFTELQRSVPGAVLTEKKASQHPVMFPEGKKINIVLGTPVE